MIKDISVELRNIISGGLYRGFFKPLAFRYDPEDVHDRMTHFGAMLGKNFITQKITSFAFGYSDPVLAQSIFSVKFENPIGLSAGFDKNAELTQIMPSVGFGFMEVGSITGEVCAGNPKPRLWRLPKSQSLVVYYGLKNDGCEAISKRLKDKNFKIPVGVSVAMTNCEANLDTLKAIKDYAKAFKAFGDTGSYRTINISCPNTLGGQPFVEPYKLDYLLDMIDEIPTKKPIFIKISPDLKMEELDALLDVAENHRVSGIICGNLTKKRTNPKIQDENVPTVGGLSGKPVQDLSDKMIAHIYQKEGKRFVIVGCGGVSSGKDAYRKIRLGASLIQMITGMIFEGPQVVSEINRELKELLLKDGFKNISEAVGVDSRYLNNPPKNSSNGLACCGMSI